MRCIWAGLKKKVLPKTTCPSHRQMCDVGKAQLEECGRQSDVRLRLMLVRC